MWLTYEMSPKGLVSLARRGAPGRRYLLTGQNVTYGELSDLGAAALGSRAPRVRVPSGGLRVLAGLLERPGLWVGRRPPLTPDEVAVGSRYLYFSNTRAVNEIGFRVRPIEETLADSVAWYRESGRLALDGRRLAAQAFRRAASAGLRWNRSRQRRRAGRRDCGPGAGRLSGCEEGLRPRDGRLRRRVRGRLLLPPQTAARGSWGAGGVGWDAPGSSRTWPNVISAPGVSLRLASHSMVPQSERSAMPWPRWTMRGSAGDASGSVIGIHRAYWSA